MSNADEVITTVVSEAKEAGHRVLALQFAKTMRVTILSFLKRKKADKAFILGAQHFMETDYGLSIVSYILGTGLSALPWFSTNKIALAMSKELRITGVALLGDLIIDAAKVEIFPLIQAAAQFINQYSEEKVLLPGVMGIGDQHTGKTAERVPSDPR